MNGFQTAFLGHRRMKKQGFCWVDRGNPIVPKGQSSPLYVVSSLSFSFKNLHHPDFATIISNLSLKQNLYNSCTFSFLFRLLNCILLNLWLVNQGAKINLFFIMCESHCFLLSMRGFFPLDRAANIMLHSCHHQVSVFLHSGPLPSEYFSSCLSYMQWKYRLQNYGCADKNPCEVLPVLRIKSKILIRPSIIWVQTTSVFLTTPVITASSLWWVHTMLMPTSLINLWWP